MSDLAPIFEDLNRNEINPHLNLIKNIFFNKGDTIQAMAMVETVTAQVVAMVEE